MSDNQQSMDDLFDSAGGGSGAPSYAWPKEGKGPKIGATIAGEITELFLTVVKDADTKEPKLNKHGQTQPQVNITLQTTLRGWEGCTNIPKAEDGSDKPASEDTGERRIYAKYRMLDAIAKAIKSSEQGKGGPKVGAKLAVRVKSLENTGKLNPLPDYDARYEPPAPATPMDAAFDTAAAPAAAAAPATAAAAPAQSNGWSDDPPF